MRASRARSALDPRDPRKHMQHRQLAILHACQRRVRTGPRCDGFSTPSVRCPTPLLRFEPLGLDFVTPISERLGHRRLLDARLAFEIRDRARDPQQAPRAAGRQAQLLDRAAEQRTRLVRGAHQRVERGVGDLRVGARTERGEASALDVRAPRRRARAPRRSARRAGARRAARATRRPARRRAGRCGRAADPRGAAGSARRRRRRSGSRAAARGGSRRGTDWRRRPAGSRRGTRRSRPRVRRRRDAPRAPGAATRACRGRTRAARRGRARRGARATPRRVAAGCRRRAGPRGSPRGAARGTGDRAAIACPAGSRPAAPCTRVTSSASAKSSGRQQAGQAPREHRLAGARRAAEAASRARRRRRPRARAWRAPGRGPRRGRGRARRGWRGSSRDPAAAPARGRAPVAQVAQHRRRDRPRGSTSRSGVSAASVPFSRGTTMRRAARVAQRQGERERAAHRAQASVERELADQAEPGRAARRRARRPPRGSRSRSADRDRRRSCARPPAPGSRSRGGPGTCAPTRRDRGPHARRALADGRLGQPDDVDARELRADPHLDLDRHPVDAGQDGAQHSGHLESLGGTRGVQGRPRPKVEGRVRRPCLPPFRRAPPGVGLPFSHREWPPRQSGGRPLTCCRKPTVCLPPSRRNTPCRFCFRRLVGPGDPVYGPPSPPDAWSGAATRGRGCSRRVRSVFSPSSACSPGSSRCPSAARPRTCAW